MRGGASCVCVVVVLIGWPVCQQQRGSLLIHPPGLNSLNQTEEILLTFRNRTNCIIQIRKGAPLVLHPVRLQTVRQAEGSKTDRERQVSEIHMNFHGCFQTLFFHTCPSVSWSCSFLSPGPACLLFYLFLYPVHAWTPFLTVLFPVPTCTIYPVSWWLMVGSKAQAPWRRYPVPVEVSCTLSPPLPCFFQFPVAWLVNLHVAHYGCHLSSCLSSLRHWFN